MDALTRAFKTSGDVSTGLIRHAVGQGIDVYGMVTLTEPDGTMAPLLARRWDADEPITAASMNKLALALWALETYAYDDYDRLKTWDGADRRAGGGAFDQPGAPKSALIIDLVEDMLALSGNTAMAILGRIDFHIANAMLRRRGYTVTRFHGVGTEGRFETGVTTAEESLRLLWDVLTFAPLSPLVRTVRSSLARSTTRLTFASHGGHWSKHGELNPDRTSDEYVRHEAGFVERGGYYAGYSVFTRFTGKVPAIGSVRSHLAERLIGRIGDNAAHVLDARPRVPALSL